MPDEQCGMGPLGPLFADFYELTMSAGYLDAGMSEFPATFECFFRLLPRDVGFAVYAGLDDLLEDLAGLRFSDDDLAYLQSLSIFTRQFIDYLRDLRFTGDVYAPPEGAPVFPYEPVLRVVAPLAQAQLVETMVLNRLNYQILVATKASRVRRAAGDDSVMEFGLRRAQGPDGGMSGTRAAIIGGCDSTSNTLAGKCLGVKVVGTQAHSWIMAFGDELEAFRTYVRSFPEHPILLVDTYDTLASGVPNAIQVFSEMRARGWAGRPGIRIDSGDQARLSKEAHRRFAEVGFGNPIIAGSSDLDEHLIAQIKQEGARINTWGVGTKLITGGRDPAIPGVYKLAAVKQHNHWMARFKISDNPGKTTDPGVKSVIRFYDPEGYAVTDVMYPDEDNSWREGDVLAHDRLVFGQSRLLSHEWERRPLLAMVMRGGERLFPRRSVMEIRAYAMQEIERIRPESRRLVNPQTYSVALSPSLALAKHEAIEGFWRSHRRPTIR